MNLILLYNTSGVEIRNETKSSKIQLQFVLLLEKYLRSHLEPDDAKKQFHRGLMLLHDIERTYELSEKRLKL